MLTDIRMHVEPDEVRQSSIEESRAQELEQNYSANMSAFKTHVPAIHTQLSNLTPSSSALFVNKSGQFNIVDYAQGKTLYGLNPDQEILQQLAHPLYSSVILDLKSSGPLLEKGADICSYLVQYADFCHQYLDDGKSDVLVSLGVGLGKHLLSLMRRYSPKHFIIYETDIAILRASLFATDWTELLNEAATKQINLYFQIGPQVSEIFQNFKELSQHFDIDSIMVFKHFNHYLYNAACDLIRNNTWQVLQSVQHLSPNLPTIVSDVPLWNDIFHASNWEAATDKDQLFVKNLSTLKRFYPELYARFKNYEPTDWQVLKRGSGLVNLIHKRHCVSFYGENSIAEGCEPIDNFEQHPSRDGLIIGYRGSKSRHFLHNHFLIKTESVTNQLERSCETHPTDTKALIMFGIGAGYGFDYLVKNKKIEQLFIFEPNSDFFYASLYAIDWQDIFEKVENDESYLYLNIGDDGRHFASDMMSHFYRIGPHVLNQTYICRGYDNRVLEQSISKLREQLKLMISMSENFDHSLAGLQHSLSSIANSTPFLSSKSGKVMPSIHYETPVFIVGNGPSLDYSISVIKEYKKQAIIVSCGTALQALHRNGITPDFHAEIEQYRSTHDWACILNDADYLKNITLISCNGIHPDTCSLYKRALLAFKQGEASTRAIHDLTGGAEFNVLDTAFPTVSNFAVNFWLAAGFNNLYLIGTDLGFIDPNHHHSKTSAYYDNSGKEVYDYSSTHSMGIQVRGNFRDWVSTKTEFDLARMSMEQAFAQFPDANIYNTSDGALIRGGSSLITDGILILTTSEQKQRSLIDFEQKCLVTLDPNPFQEAFSKKYNQPLLIRSIEELQKLSDVNIESIEQLEQLVTSVRDYVFAQYENTKSATTSLFFFYFHAMTNSFNALMTKVMMQKTEEKSVAAANEIINHWQTTLADCHSRCQRAYEQFDTSTSFIWKRESIILKQKIDAIEPINLVLSQSDELNKSIINSVKEMDTSSVKYSETFCVGYRNIAFAETIEQARQIVQDNTSADSIVQTEHKHSSHLLVLFGHYDMWYGALPELKSSKHFSILVCPPYLQLFEKQEVLLGNVPAFCLNYIVQESIKRSFDTDAFKMIIYKPVFCKDGLNSAYDKQLNEFDTPACKYIEKYLLPLIDMKQFASFKTYVAELKDREEFGVDKATITDALRSRGQIFDRECRDYDLLGVWFTLKDVQAQY